MEVENLSETFVSFYQTIGRHIPHGSNFSSFIFKLIIYNFLFYKAGTSYKMYYKSGNIYT